jgi:hypothetical protein
MRLTASLAMTGSETTSLAPPLLGADQVQRVELAVGYRLGQPGTDFAANRTASSSAAIAILLLLPRMVSIATGACHCTAALELPDAVVASG